MIELLDWLQNNERLPYILPWLVLGAVLVPLSVLALRKQIVPHTPLAILAIVPCVLSIVMLARPGIFLLVLTADLAIVLVAVADIFLLPGLKSFSAERATVRVASLKQRHQVAITLTNHSRRGWLIGIRDDLAEAFETEPDEFSRQLPARSRTTLHYEFRAMRRGAFTLEFVYLLVRSPLGMWRRHLRCPAKTVIHVYPDMQQLGEYAMLARTNRLSLMGVRRARKVGQDHDFERLRDYSLDDNYKHIDWRATARRNRLTVKDYQTSQSQRIVFLMDCGRMMTNEAAGLSLLDHSLNAMLMLSFVALHQGDSVGLICFSDEIHRFVPPRGGMNQMNRLLHASFDRFPRLVESRYDEAFFYLSSRCKKRSLVVLMTNLIDEVNSHQIEQYLSALSGRHLPLGVLMRDHRLFDAVAGEHPTGPDLYRAAAAAGILTWRQQVLTDLQHKGILALDVFPENMTAPLVNRYLEIKARHLL